MKIKDAYEELKAITPPGEHLSVDYTMSRYSSGTEDIECTVYIDSIGTFTSATFKKALDQAKDALGLIELDDPDIEG